VYDAFSDNLIILKTRYFSSSQGPAVHRVFGSFVSVQFPIYVRTVEAAIVADGEAKATRLRRELEAALESLDSLKMQLSELQRSNSSLIAEKCAAVVSVERAVRELKRTEVEYESLAQRVGELKSSRELRNQKQRSDVAPQLETNGSCTLSTMKYLAAHDGAFQSSAPTKGVVQASLGGISRPAALKVSNAIAIGLRPRDKKAIAMASPTQDTQFPGIAESSGCRCLIQ